MKSSDSETLITLANAPCWHPMREHVRRVNLGGRLTNTVVSGEGILFQRKFGTAYLIVTAYDYYDAVSHWFYLLDVRGRIIDVVSPPDYFGFLGDVTEVNQSSIRFRFNPGGEDWWSLQVDLKGRWCYDADDIRYRLNRFLFLKRHLSLKCEGGRPIGHAASRPHRF